MLPFGMVEPRVQSLAAILALGVIVGGRHWAKQARKEFRAYAAACVGWATGWMLYTAEVGMWGSVGKFAPLIGLAGWIPLAWLWWERHRRRVATGKPDTSGTEQHPFVTAWRAKVEPVLNWTISHPEATPTGQRYRLQLVPGQAIEDAKKAHDQLSLDGGGHLTYLAPSRVNLQLMQERYPDIRFSQTREH